MASSFDRDFGYLLPFLDRVTQAASDHPDAQVRAELAELLGGQKERWSRIRALLSEKPGTPGKASARALPEPAHAWEASGARTPKVEDAPGENVTAAGPLGLTMTVGSLRKGP